MATGITIGTGLIVAKTIMANGRIQLPTQIPKKDRQIIPQMIFQTGRIEHGGAEITGKHDPLGLEHQVHHLFLGGNSDRFNMA